MEKQIVVPEKIIIVNKPMSNYQGNEQMLHGKIKFYFHRFRSKKIRLSFSETRGRKGKKKNPKVKKTFN